MRAQESDTENSASGAGRLTIAAQPASMMQDGVISVQGTGPLPSAPWLIMVISQSGAADASGISCVVVTSRKAPITRKWIDRRSLLTAMVGESKTELPAIQG